MLKHICIYDLYICCIHKNSNDGLEVNFGVYLFICIFFFGPGRIFFLSFYSILTQITRIMELLTCVHRCFNEIQAFIEIHKV